jgi:hypothetical protein
MRPISDSRGLSPNNVAAILEKETSGLDARFFSGFADVSELPSAYKSAANVRSQIEHYGLAEVVDEVIPYTLGLKFAPAILAMCKQTNDKGLTTAFQKHSMKA